MKKFLARSIVLPAVVLLLVAPLASAIGLATSAGAASSTAKYCAAYKVFAGQIDSLPAPPADTPTPAALNAAASGLNSYIDVLKNVAVKDPPPQATLILSNAVTDEITLQSDYAAQSAATTLEASNPTSTIDANLLVAATASSSAQWTKTINELLILQNFSAGLCHTTYTTSTTYIGIPTTVPPTTPTTTPTLTTVPVTIPPTARAGCPAGWTTVSIGCRHLVRSATTAAKCANDAGYWTGTVCYRYETPAGLPIVRGVAPKQPTFSPSPTITIVFPTPTTLTVTWLPPTAGRPVVGYTVTVFANNKVVASASTAASARNAVLRGLKPNTKYTLVLIAHTTTGTIQISRVVSTAPLAAG